MKDIWYLLDCQGQDEQAMVKLCEKHVPQDVLEAAWVLKFQKLLRYQGEWHVAEKNLFPGHIMLSVADRKDSKSSLEEALAGIFPARSREERDRCLCAVRRDSEKKLRELCCNGALIKLSRGRIRDGHVTVTGGPLEGCERSIRKIDRHKRIAWLELPGGAEGPGASVLERVCVGLEVYEKQD